MCTHIHTHTHTHHMLCVCLCDVCVCVCLHLYDVCGCVCACACVCLCMHVCVCLMCVCLAFRVMLNGMTKVDTPLLASSSSLGRPTSFLTRNTCLGCGGFTLLGAQVGLAWVVMHVVELHWLSFGVHLCSLSYSLWAVASKMD